MMLLDEGDEGSRIKTMIELWDITLQHESTQIWGVAVNDHFGAYRDPGLPPDSRFPPLTAKNLDRGKLVVLLPTFDLNSYQEAVDSGAFFAVVEDSSVKNAYPHITQISVAGAQVEIEASTSPVMWIGNGETVGSGSTLDLSVLAPALKYVRAEVRDGDGRTLYLQPFSLELCGDANGNHVLDPDDGNELRLGLAGLQPLPGQACKARLGNEPCDIADLARLQRAIAGFPPNLACN